MTKGTTTCRPSAQAAEPKTHGDTGGAKAKPPRGKAATVNQTSTASSGETGAPIPAAAPITTPKPQRQTKAALLRARLAAPGGVSLAALIAATGWQAHTLRAALSGLRKEGLNLTRRRDGEDTIYAIAPGDAEAACTVDTVDGTADGEAAPGAPDPSGAGGATGTDGDAAISEDSPAPSAASPASQLTGRVA
ncbi:DUF3489 domain-containing protein [Tabrizicola soli]|uniref:DUF3489 domain-containing protein n=1 Tax=Tabrizicola soli TaxID=2185115 RepID=A0ABV7DV56_9RHOB|nr:DUF3489 domain-containing protein [Tabrizicola soli]